MQTSPHCRIVGPIAEAKNAALPSEPWLSTTAGKGPAPGGFIKIPARSYVTPSTVPRYVHAAPLDDSGSPVTTNASFVSTPVCVERADPQALAPPRKKRASSAPRCCRCRMDDFLVLMSRTTHPRRAMVTAPSSFLSAGELAHHGGESA